MEKINLYKEVKKGVHVPTNKSEQVYYNSYREDEYGNLIMKDSNIYNSPTNVKRVKIAENVICIEAHNAIKGYAGGRYKGTLIEHNVKKEIEVFKKNGQWEVFEGDPFNALLNPWITSNIEEIYFDASVFLSAEVRRRVTFLNITPAIVVACMTGTVRGGVATANVSEVLGLDKETLKKKFPRLRVIAFISNLKDVKAEFVEDKPLLYRATNKSECEYVDTLWIDSEGYKNEQANKVYIQIVEKFNPDLSYDNFTVRDQYYKYDDLVLKPLISQIKENVHKLRVAETMQRVRGTKEEIDTSLEESMDRLLEVYGQKVGVNIIKTAVSQISKEELERIYSSMSSSSEKKYRALISN